MSFERLEAWTQRGLVNEFVRFVEGHVKAHQQRSAQAFVFGLAGSELPEIRARWAEALHVLGESESIDWSRFALFLVEERFGKSCADVSNARLVQDSLLTTLERRGVSIPENNVVLPNTRLDAPEACAKEYQNRLLSMLKAQGADGPHLVWLSLEDDLSIGGLFPSWYSAHSHADRWSEVTAKSFKVLVTETFDLDSVAPERICVNLGVIRRAKTILVDVHESTSKGWDSVKEALEAMKDEDPPAPDTFTRVSSLPPASRKNSREPPAQGQASGPTRKLKPGLSSPPLQSIPSPRGGGGAELVSPLNYLMKYKHITIMRLLVDLKNHFTVAVIGAAGDLARKKTIPALFQLHLNNHLPPSTRIIGCDNPGFPAHADIRTAADWWEKRLLPMLQQQLEGSSGGLERDLKSFRNRLDFVPINLHEEGTLRELDKRILGNSSAHKHDNRIFYLALPSFLFATAVERIRHESWSDSGFMRVVVEKPFGRNHAEARALADELSRHLEESQIYRIDHYLAKTLVLNILTLRFANREFGTLFHTFHVANVRITFQEDFGVEGRAGYFNDYGIIRDIMQNHLMQVLTLIAMEAPASLEAEDVRDEKVKVLKQIRPIKPEDCVIGQYEGYQDDKQIAEKNKQRGYASRCPTFAVLVLYLDNERWSGVPFIMKAGKALSKTQTLVRVQFKKAPPHSLFGDQPQNELVIRIQPNEAIYYKMIAKMPGISQKARDVRRTVLDLDLKKGIDRLHRIPQAYEKLLYDVLQGESHNFVRRDELEQAWRIFDPLLRKLEEEEMRVPLPYAFGSGGPKAADELIRSTGFQKYTPTGLAVAGFSDDEK